MLEEVLERPILGDFSSNRQKRRTRKNLMVMRILYGLSGGNGFLPFFIVFQSFENASKTFILCGFLMIGVSFYFQAISRFLEKSCKNRVRFTLLY